MRKKSKVKYVIMSILLLLVIVGLFMIFNNKSEAQEETGLAQTTETKVIKTDIYNTVSNSSYIVTGLEENKELHATYYFEEIYFEENQKISQGENILKYTNGKFLVAPYDCVITKTSLPNSGEVCTNKHYITLQSTENLKMILSIDEDELSNIKLGQEARITVSAFEDKVLLGYVTNISNIANYSSSGSKFEVVVNFINDGDILLGMSAKCEVILEKAEGVIAVAKEAVTTEKGTKTVNVKTGDNQISKVQVETGISNDAYIEIKSGLNEDDIVIIEKNTIQNRNTRNTTGRGQNNGQERQKPSNNGGNGGQFSKSPQK